jgi:hypothetical protein
MTLRLARTIGEICLLFLKSFFFKKSLRKERRTGIKEQTKFKSEIRSESAANVM